MTTTGNISKRAARGLTLVEVLASLAILSMVVAAGGAWLVSSARAGRALSERGSARLAVERCARFLRADLEQSAPGGVTFDAERDRMTIVTNNRLPDQPPGWRRAAWRFKKNEALIVRESTLLRGDDSTSSDPALLGAAVFRVELEHSEDEMNALSGVDSRNNEKIFQIMIESQQKEQAVVRWRSTWR